MVLNLVKSQSIAVILKKLMTYISLKQNQVHLSKTNLTQAVPIS
jgi:hypothetical protein